MVPHRSTTRGYLIILEGSSSRQPQPHHSIEYAETRFYLIELFGVIKLVPRLNPKTYVQLCIDPRALYQTLTNDQLFPQLWMTHMGFLFNISFCSPEECKSCKLSALYGKSAMTSHLSIHYVEHGVHVNIVWIWWGIETLYAPFHHVQVYMYHINAVQDRGYPFWNPSP